HVDGRAASAGNPAGNERPKPAQQMLAHKREVNDSRLPGGLHCSQLNNAAPSLKASSNSGSLESQAALVRSIASGKARCGIVKVNVLPCPAARLTQTRPPCIATRCRELARPS